MPVEPFTYLMHYESHIYFAYVTRCGIPGKSSHTDRTIDSNLLTSKATFSDSANCHTRRSVASACRTTLVVNGPGTPGRLQPESSRIAQRRNILIIFTV